MFMLSEINKLIKVTEQRRDAAHEKAHSLTDTGKRRQAQAEYEACVDAIMELNQFRLSLPCFFQNRKLRDFKDAMFARAEACDYYSGEHYKKHEKLWAKDNRAYEELTEELTLMMCFQAKFEVYLCTAEGLKDILWNTRAEQRKYVRAINAESKAIRRPA